MNTYNVNQTVKEAQGGDGVNQLTSELAWELNIEAWARWIYLFFFRQVYIYRYVATDKASPT